jgi:CHAD domain-containing protein
LDGTLEAPRAQAASGPRPSEPVSARQSLQLIARACVQQIQAYEPRLRRSRSPEALHQIRVALRRWRTALLVFGDASGLSQDRTRATLKWLALELNEARDLDVFAAAMEPHKGEDQGAQSLWTALEGSRADAYARADEALQSDRLRRLLWRTAHAARAGEDDSPPARQVATKALERRWKRIKKRGPRIARLAAEDRHHLRIQAKKVRYAAELCADLFGHPRRQARMARALRRMQDSLGVLNDLAVGETIALKLARKTGTPEAAFAAGRLAGTRASQQEPAVLKEARAAYDDFAAVRRFWAG